MVFINSLLHQEGGKSDVFGSPDKLREVVLKFNEQNALDEMILAPATYKNKLTLQDHATVITILT